MKFLLTVAAVIAVAVAGPAHRGVVSPIAAGPAPVVVEPEVGPVAPGSAGPAPIIELPIVAPGGAGPAPVPEFEPIAIGPAIIDEFEPIAVGPVAVDFEHVEAAPSLPKIQIILNINLPAGESVATPVEVVDVAPVSPIQVIDITPVSPIQVVDGATPIQVVDGASPVQVVDAAPVAPEPVQIGTPVIPTPAINLPIDL